MPVKIQIKSLYKSFGNRNVLSGVSLDIHEGEVLCIVGPSGTGKSVLLKHLIGLLKPDSGEIIIDNMSLNESNATIRDDIRSRFGVLFQGSALFDSMNIYDNVAFGMRRKKISEGEISIAVPFLLGKVGLFDVEQKFPSDISGGMQKRVGLARSLAIKPKIMLYDEPTTGVDPITGGSVDRLILEMNKDFKITSVVITHDMNSVKRIADRVAMLFQGKIIFVGKTEDLFLSQDTRIINFVQDRIV